MLSNQHWLNSMQHESRERDLEESNSASSPKELVLDFARKATFSLVNSLVDGRQPAVYFKRTVRDDDRNCSQSYCKLDLTSEKNAALLTLYFKTLSIVQSLIESNQCATIRDIYYQYKHLFRSQSQLEKILNDLARTIGVPRTSLNMIASAKGLVAGDLQLVLNTGQTLNCCQFKYGSLVPSKVDEIRAVRSNAQFVLVVEKDATFQRLLDDDFTSKYPAILITGKGVPDISTRQLLKLLHDRLPIKFYCLTDANPYGVQIMSIYKYGSKEHAHDSANLSAPRIEWLGLKLTDLNQLEFAGRRGNFLLKMSADDKRLARSLIEKLTPLFEFDVIRQLEFMLESECKAELQYLQNISNSFLCDVYLRAKLKPRDSEADEPDEAHEERHSN